MGSGSSRWYISPIVFGCFLGTIHRKRTNHSPGEITRGGFCDASSLISIYPKDCSI